VQWPIGIGGQGNEGVANQVRNTQGGVGYIELAYARQNKIPYGSVKNRAGNYIDPDPKNVTNAAASLKDLPADLRFSITDQAGPQAYPIAGTTWVLLYKNQDAAQGKLVTAFIEWAITDGQKYANELDYAALAKNLVQKVASHPSNRHVWRKILSSQVKSLRWKLHICVFSNIAPSLI
jgi:phosphate transport system substrate-binding protein